MTCLAQVFFVYVVKIIWYYILVNPTKPIDESVQMLLSVIVAATLAVAAIQLYRTAKVTVGKNELVVMTRNRRMGSSVEVISRAGVHRRPTILGWRQALRLGTGRQDAQVTMTVGPEATKVGLDITLLSTGSANNVEGAKRLYFTLRGESETKDEPTVLAGRRREAAVSIVRDAIVRVLAETNYEEALKLLNDGIVEIIGDHVKEPLKELAFTLDKVNIMTLELGETRRAILDSEAINASRRAQEDIDAERIMDARAAQMAADLELKQHAATLGEMDDARRVASAKAQEIAARHEATARALRLAPVNEVLAVLERLGITGDAAHQLVGSVVNTSGPREKRTTPHQIDRGTEDVTSELPVVSKEEAAAARAEATANPQTGSATHEE